VWRAGAVGSGAAGPDAAGPGDGKRRPGAPGNEKGKTGGGRNCVAINANSASEFRLPETLSADWFMAR
jgi:hypothetical protein